MRLGLVFFALFLSTSTLAQSPVNTAINSNDLPLPPVTLNHHGDVPETPAPKIIDGRTCSDSNVKSCAAVGGPLHLSDTFGPPQQTRSWTAAATSPGMLLALGLLIPATVADIETTQSCIRAGTCKEGNPLMGQSRAQEYSVAMSINALAFWAAAEQKRHGHRAVPRYFLWGATAMHAAQAAHNSTLAAK